MRAFKFLARGALGPFTGFPWPVPNRGQPGEWVSAPGADIQSSGIHACRPIDLCYWTDDELWAVELEQPLYELPLQVVATRGRLIEHVDGWNETSRRAFAEMCILRARDAVCGALRRLGAHPEAELLSVAATPEALSAAAGPLTDAFPIVSYVTDILHCLADCGAASSVAANAAAAANPMPLVVEEERRWHSRWLIERLGIA